MESIHSGLSYVTSSLSSSKFLAGLAMILVNIGGKYVDLRLTRAQEAFIKGSFVREMFIFAFAWMGTKDIVTSFILTASFMIMAGYLFNEKSQLCVMPAKYRHLDKVLDTDGDGVVSPAEVEKARAILERAKKQEHRANQVQALSFMASNGI